MSNCPQCQAPLPENAPLGVCPACLLEGGARAGRESEEVELGFLEDSERADSLGVFDGYEVCEVLGQGATGIVLKAEDPLLKRMVAVKVLHPVLATSATSRERFLREARAAAAVSHDHVVTIHAVGEWSQLPYLVMEFVSGTSLEERLHEEGVLEVKEVLRIAHQIAAGLAAAHGQGLIHRDIKPGNVLLENGVERVKLVDFGLARAQEETSLTLTGFVSGTPQYMAPEQVADGETDERSDLFSLGAVVYAMATGRAPFVGKSSMAVLRKVAEGEVLPPRTVDKDVPAWLDEMIVRLLSKERATRPASAEEVANWFGERLGMVQRGEEPRCSRSWWGRKRSVVGGCVALVCIGLPLFVLNPFRPTGMKESGDRADATLPGDPEPGPRTGDGPGKQIAFDRNLFDRLLEAAEQEWRLRTTQPSGSLRDLLDGRVGVEFLGWTNQDKEDLWRPEAFWSYRTKAPADCTYVVFILGNNQARWRTTRQGFPLELENKIKSEPNAPPGGVWIGGISPEAARRLLPGERALQGCLVWQIRAALPGPSDDRMLLGGIISHLLQTGAYRQVGDPPGLETLLQEGAEVHHLAWRAPPSVPGVLDEPLEDLFEFAESMGVPDAERAIFLVFVTGGGRIGPKEPELLLPAQARAIASARRPPTRAWVATLLSDEGSALLPAERRSKGIDLWAVIPPRADAPDSGLPAKEEFDSEGR